MKTLNDKELAVINSSDMKVNLSSEKSKVSFLKIRNMELQMKLLSMEIAAEKNTLETLRSEEANAKIERADNLKIIAKKKSLKDGWGFNPDSGEIIEN